MWIINGFGFGNNMYFYPAKNWPKEMIKEQEDIEVLEETEFEEEIGEGEKFIYKRIKIKNNVGNFEYYEKLDDKETVETSIITMQVFDRVETTKEFERQQEFTKAIDKKYSGRLYNFDNIKKLYNELKEYFENNKEGENE